MGTKGKGLLKLLKFLLIFLGVLLALSLGLFIASLDSEPLVVENSSTQVDQAESVKVLMGQLRNSIRKRNYQQNILITEDQLNSLVGLAQRANPKLHGRVNITQHASIMEATYQLPSNPFGRYINLNVAVLPGKSVTIEYVSIGSISIPGDWAMSALILAVNWYTKSDIAQQFIRQVESISMNQNSMQLTVRPLDAFLRELNEIKENSEWDGDEELRFRTRYYLDFLNQLDISKRAFAQSLANYIGPLFEQAQRRSVDDTAAEENEAAILALAIYAGHHRFANFIGDVQPIVGMVVLPRAKPVLALRADLNLHFIFSAAIKILSEQGLSFAIGEFKELMDRGNGGSGYSFVDLAADIAGVQFAQAATDKETARVVQKVLAGNTKESAFFPNIEGLPEGLSKTAFTQQFTQIDSPKYRQMVEEINNRVAELPIHRNSKVAVE